MAEFNAIFERMMSRRGGYLLQVLPRRRGGKTYAGIGREFHREWAGWALIDRGDTLNPLLPGLVWDFYRQRFWEPIDGERLVSQEVACALFGYAVEGGTEEAVGLAQRLLGLDETGMMEEATLAALNAAGEEAFVREYAEARERAVPLQASGGSRRDRGNPVSNWFSRTLISG